MREENGEEKKKGQNRKGSHVAKKKIKKKKQKRKRRIGLGPEKETKRNKRKVNWALTVKAQAQVQSIWASLFIRPN